MKHRFKNIAQAMAEIRPDDFMVQVLDNRFVLARPAIIKGGYSDQAYVFYLYNNTVISFSNVSCQKGLLVSINYVLSLPNTERVIWCMNHKENGKPYHYVRYTFDNRRRKKTARQLLRAIQLNPIKALH